MSEPTIPIQPPPARPQQPRRDRQAQLNVASLVLSGLLLVCSLVAGGWLIRDVPEGVHGVGPGHARSQAQHIEYGGDAYTGIQNAAAETEQAVVEQTNTLAGLAAAQVNEQTAEWNRLWTALGLLIMLLGGINFVVALQRFVLVNRD